MDEATSTTDQVMPPMAPDTQQSPGVPVKAAVTVRAPLEEVYAFWSGFRSMPSFMDTLASVQITGDGRAHWVLRGPAGMKVEFDAEITEAIPNERIAWRTTPGSKANAMGAIMNRDITIKSSQCHVHCYMQPLLEHIQNGDIDPTFIITHTLPLDAAPKGYDMLKNKLDNCEKVVLKA
ncbi:MAG: hypothetical protein QOF33_3580 [Thermomicrobiales bacterium]|nr:hypothetical protein [Thermomicrobiales bacterium]